MRLKVSRSSAEETLSSLILEGYRISQYIDYDYHQKKQAEKFDPDVDVSEYRTVVSEWFADVGSALREVFPSDLEIAFFHHRRGKVGINYPSWHPEVANLVFDILPERIDRLKRVLERDLQRYTDLPIKMRLFVEDIDSFRKVRDVNSAMVLPYLKNGYLDRAEDEIQLSLEQILNVPFHKKDWGGENNDLYTANLVVNGERRATAFLLKGNGLKRSEMRISDCGKNGDQIIRLLDCPAELFVIQFVGNISEMVIKDIESKVAEKRSQDKKAWYLIMDGQDTARVLMAYSKLAQNAA